MKRYAIEEQIILLCHRIVKDAQFYAALASVERELPPHYAALMRGNGIYARKVYAEAFEIDAYQKKAIKSGF